MKTIGLIGGMSWESTITYYKVINEVVKEQLGGLHSAKILLYSVDFFEIEKYQASGDWNTCAKILSETARNLEKAGADFIVICTNTMHKVVSFIEKQITIPILHIADATAMELKKSSICKVALLGTKYTMLQDFYKERLVTQGIEVIIPNDEDIEIVNSIIYSELCLGKISNSSKKKYLCIIDDLSKNEAQAVILGCTEIGLLIEQKDTTIPLFDTAKIHAVQAAMHSIEP